MKWRGVNLQSELAVRNITFEQEVHTSVEQRVVITFLSREGLKPAEILRRVSAQFAGKTLSRSQVYDCHKKMPVAESQCKMKPMYSNRGQAPVRRIFLRSVKRLNGKLLHT